MSLYHGDCLDVMAEMEPESVDAIVTDPPYGLEFMGMAWDQFDGRENGTPRPRNEWGDFGSREHARSQDDLHRVTVKKARALQSFSAAWAEAAYRVAKPSAYLLAFGGPRGRGLDHPRHAGLGLRLRLPEVQGQPQARLGAHRHGPQAGTAADAGYR